MKKLLQIENLSVKFNTHEGISQAVDGVSFNLDAGETLGLVGESGCGKSVTSLSLIGLIPSPPGVVTSDRILFRGKNILEMRKEEIRRIRGKDISMIFQEPMTSLNPVLPIGRQVAEPLIVHKGIKRGDAYKEAAVWLEHVKIPGARKRMNDYPHQLSGGMRQRVMIAMAMVCRPKILIADEPTTALDVTIQAQVLSLMLSLKEELGMAVLLVTHDLGVVAQMANRVVVMYAGEIVEEASVMDIFNKPFHPYSRGLLRSIPRIGARTARLNEITGTVPLLTKALTGCRFADRCSHVFSICREKHPHLFSVGDNHKARCWLKEHPERRKADA